MNNNRLLMGLLLASWTLNVALGVALFLKTQYPAGGYWGDPPGNSATQMPEEPGPPFRMNPRFIMDPDHRSAIEPLINTRRDLLIEIADLVTSDTLDTVRIRSLSDSLEELNSFMQRKHIDHMIEMHDKIPPHARRELVPRMMSKFGGEGRHFKRGQKMHRDRGDRNRDRQEEKNLNQ